MTVWSNLVPPSIKTCTCRQLLHPEQANCLEHVFLCFRNTFYGVSFVYAVFCVFQYLRGLAKTSETKENEYQWEAKRKQFLRTTYQIALFGLSLEVVTFSLVCLFRNLFGRFYRPFMPFIPSFIGGLGGISALEGKEKCLCFFVFTSSAISILLKKFELEGNLKLKLSSKTLLFMILSGAISYLMAGIGRERLPTNFWPFRISVSKEKDTGQCCHQNSCYLHIATGCAKYFSTGAFFNLLSLLFILGRSQLRKPSLLFHGIMNRSFFQLPAFLSIYHLIYQTTRCYLYKKYRDYRSKEQSAIAGFAAGCSFMLNPTPTNLNAAIITFCQMLTKVYTEKGWFPRLPYMEISFALSTAVLFETMIIAPKLMPGLLKYIIVTTTCGKVNEVHHNMRSLMSELNKYTISS